MTWHFALASKANFAGKSTFTSYLRLEQEDFLEISYLNINVEVSENESTE